MILIVKLFSTGLKLFLDVFRCGDAIHCKYQLIKIKRKFVYILGTIKRRLQRQIPPTFSTLDNKTHVIILDACRHDVLASVLKELKTYTPKISKISFKISPSRFTSEFLRENLDFFDLNTIYVTANPWVDKILKNKKRVFKIIPAWKYKWSSKLNAVPPKDLYLETAKVLKKYPKKRFVVHFIQPHHPFIMLKEVEKIYKIPLWQLVEMNIISSEMGRWGYFHNVRYVIGYAIRLAYLLPGDVIITADHGDGMGEKLSPLLPLRIYGHPGASIEPIVKVPWILIRQIDKDPKVIKKELRKLRFIERREDEKRKIKRITKMLKNI